MSEEVPTNVILFPVVPKHRPPQSLEEIYKNVSAVRASNIEEVIELSMLVLFDHMHACGYSFEEGNTNKDIAFLIEALKSILMKHDGMDHSFQTLADKYFTEDDTGDIIFNMGDQG